jgi:hypothetical protein
VQKPRFNAPAMTGLVLGAFAIIVGSIIAVIALAAFTGGPGSAGSPVPVSNNHTTNDSTVSDEHTVTPTSTVDSRAARTQRPTPTPTPTQANSSSSTSPAPSATHTPRPRRTCGQGQVAKAEWVGLLSCGD